jgi:drug/metabolite transporter superfamily protein YnfA
MNIETVLSVVMLAALALVAGAVVLWRRGQRPKAGLMVLLAAIMLVNVMIWTLPDSDGVAPVERAADGPG